MAAKKTEGSDVSDEFEKFDKEAVMSHTDPSLRAGAATGVSGSDVLRTLLWLVLVSSAIGSTVASYSGLSTRVHLALGTVVALCVAALVVQRLRRRR